MICEEGAWTAPSGRRLAYRIWRPETVRHLLVVLHGYGEHSGRYAGAADVLTRYGLAVAAPDHWGHGRSGGARGDIVSVDRVVDDELAWAAATVVPLLGAAGYSVLGHSFGGLVAIRWAMRQPPALRRLIAQSPLLEAGFTIPPLKLALARLLNRCWPSFPVAMDLDPAALSHDAQVVAAYRADPLVHNRMTVRSYFSLLAARDAAMASPERLRVPVLMLCAGEDRIVSLPAARRWFDRLPGEKSSKIFDGAFHELHHEPARAQALAAAAEWALAGAGRGEG